MIGHFHLPHGIFIDTESDAISIQLNAEIWKLPAEKFKALLEHAGTNVRYARDLEAIESFGYIRLSIPDVIKRAAERIHANPFASDETKTELANFISKVKAREARRAIRRVPRKSIKKEVIKRDKSHCRYCGEFVDKKIQIDHIVPYTLGGKTEIDNLAVTCIACNLKKNGRTPEQAGMILLDVPR